MAYRSISNFREKKSRPTMPGEKIRRTYLWQMNAKGEKMLVIDQEIDQQAEIDSFLEETKIENILRRASIDPEIAERLKPETGGGIMDLTEAPQTLAELQNIMLRAKQIWKDIPKEVKLKFDNDVDKFISSYGTIEWAKNLGIMEEEPKAEPNAKEAKEAKE
nr:virion structural protein [Microvirus sp.]